MSPFASCLLELRLNRGIRQGDLAVLIGYDQTYISALETALKGPPTPEFVEALIEKLELSAEEAHKARSCAEVSDRKLALDVDSHPDVYLMLAAIRRRLPNLHPAQARLIRGILELPETMRIAELEPMSPLSKRRRPTAKRKEAVAPKQP